MAKETAKFVNIGDIRLKINIPELEQCYPGLDPFEYNVVVAPGTVSKTVGKSGLLIAPEMLQDNLNMAVQVGRLISVSPVAFGFVQWPEGTQPPQIGDMVLFAKFAGGPFDGVDGREYRMIKDKDIIGVVPPVDEVRLAKAKALNENQAKVA